VTQSGGSCGTYLTMTLIDSNNVSPGVSVTSSTCSSAPTATTGCGTPRSFGTQVTIQLTFKLDKAIFLLGTGGSISKPWLGISFPSQLQSTETAMAE